MVDEYQCPICNGPMQKYQPFCVGHEQAWKESVEYKCLDITSDDSYDYCVASFVHKQKLILSQEPSDG